MTEKNIPGIIVKTCFINILKNIINVFLKFSGTQSVKTRAEDLAEPKKSVRRTIQLKVISYFIETLYVLLIC